MTPILLILLVFVTAIHVRPDAYWQKGCADKLINVSPVKRISIGRTDPKTNYSVQTGTNVYLRGTMWCRAEFFCAMVYYTFRHVKYGPVCPYQAFSELQCTTQKKNQQSKKNPWVDEHAMFITDVDGFNGAQQKYEVGIEVYHDCDTDRSSKNGTIKKIVHLLTDIRGDRMCQSIDWEMEVNGKGDMDFNRDQANRYEFYHSNRDFRTEGWLNGSNKGTTGGRKEKVYKRCGEF